MDKLEMGQDHGYLESLDYLANLTKFGINLGLERIRQLLSRLGNPEKSLKIVHIGGTNGKGSTTVLTAEILREAGYKVGMFTSPHLHDYRERMTINGQMIPKERVVQLVTKLRPHLEELVASGVEHPTEFEVSTTMAFLYFAEEQVDYALIEVGLGGEIDSTNVVAPLVSVVTNVGMDHMDYLGSDLPSIAKVKAGIIKANSVAVTAAERPEVLDVLAQRSREVGVTLWRVGDDVRWESRWSGELEQEFDVFGIHGSYPKLRLSLIGQHQLRNAATAITICEVLNCEYNALIPREAIYTGLRKAQWPGRLELISLRPKVLLDGAHNVDGATVLAAALPNYAYKRLVLCLGMLGDKEREQVVDILVPLADEVIVTKPNSPRSGDWEALAQHAAKHGKPVTIIEDTRAAVADAVQRLQEDDMLCVTGSLYMLAEARGELLNILRETRD